MQASVQDLLSWILRKSSEHRALTAAECSNFIRILELHFLKDGPTAKLGDFQKMEATLTYHHIMNQTMTVVPPTLILVSKSMETCGSHSNSHSAIIQPNKSKDQANHQLFPALERVVGALR